MLLTITTLGDNQTQPIRRGLHSVHNLNHCLWEAIVYLFSTILVLNKTIMHHHLLNSSPALFGTRVRHTGEENDYYALERLVEAPLSQTVTLHWIILPPLPLISTTQRHLYRLEVGRTVLYPVIMVVYFTLEVAHWAMRVDFATAPQPLQLPVYWSAHRFSENLQNMTPLLKSIPRRRWGWITLTEYECGNVSSCGERAPASFNVLIVDQVLKFYVNRLVTWRCEWRFRVKPLVILK